MQGGFSDAKKIMASESKHKLWNRGDDHLRVLNRTETAQKGFARGVMPFESIKRGEIRRTCLTSRGAMAV